MLLDLCHFCVLIILLLAQEGLTVVVVEISQPNGRRVIDLAEVQLFQDGLQLPEYLTKFSYSSPTLWHHDAEFCNDGNLLTSCHNSLKFNESSGVWEGEEANPSLYIMLDEAFFDEMVVIPTPTRTEDLMGAEIALYDNDRPMQMMRNAFTVPRSKYIIPLGSFLQREKRNSIRLVDVFLYNGDLIAPTRIKYLFDVVDEFMIIESWFTFSGQAKPFLYFYEPDIYAKFLPYMDKIKYIVVKDVPDTPPDYTGPQFKYAPGTLDNWWRETYVRSYFKLFIRPYSDEGDAKFSDSSPEMYIICDCDEIPDRGILEKLHDSSKFPEHFDPDVPIKFRMLSFYYNFQWMMKSYWAGAYMTSEKGVFTMHDISHHRYFDGYEYIGGGWHCSYFTSIENMIRKLESFSHQEYNVESNKEAEHVKNCLLQGLDIHRRDDWRGFHKLGEESIVQIVPDDLYSFHLEVKASQSID